MKSPFRRRALNFDDDNDKDEPSVVFDDQHHHNRSRAETTSSWPGSFRPEPPQNTSLAASKLIWEEGRNVALYLAGSSILRVLFHAASKILSSYSRLCSTASSLESFLQAAWLYYLSTASTSTTTSASHSKNSRQPLLAARIASWRLHRVCVSELALIALTHVSLLLLHGWILSYNVSWIAALGLDQGKTTASTSSKSFQAFGQSIMETSLCVVLLLVGPALLQINRLPPSLVVLLLRPPFTMLLVTPNLCFRTLEQLASQSLAGLVAGKVMEMYFPDDPAF